MVPCQWGLVKHENMISNKLLKVKFLPLNDNEADNDGVSSLSERLTNSQIISFAILLQWKCDPYEFV